MIPAFNQSHVLPPFMGDAHSLATASPYEVDAVELVARFATTPTRCTLLKGLLEYRSAWRTLGFTDGFQWIDGSFVEDIEAHASRSPNDIDVVTFAHPPTGMTAPEIQTMMRNHPTTFDRAQCRTRYGIDGFLVRLNLPAHKLIVEATYWYGLFSHRRGDQVWKGMLKVPLSSNDEDAMIRLNEARQEGAGDVAA